MLNFAKKKGVWKHFLQEPPRLRMKIFFRGMGSKLMVAPLAGLPLLAYDSQLFKWVFRELVTDMMAFQGSLFKGIPKLWDSD